jgi:hypothetical protein
MSRRVDQRSGLALFGLAVVILAAILHAYRLVLESRIIEEAPHADRFPIWLQLYLLFAFLVVAAGLLFGTRVGLACSILGLLCVFVGHLGWLHYSQAVLDAMNQDGLHPELIPPNVWGFIGARWWDVILLVLFIILFVWEIKVLFKRAEKPNHNEVGS